MMKLLYIVIPYVKKFQEIYEWLDIPLESVGAGVFSPEISIFCYIKNTVIDYVLIYNFWLF